MSNNCTYKGKWEYVDRDGIVSAGEITCNEPIATLTYKLCEFHWNEKVADENEKLPLELRKSIYKKCWNCGRHSATEKPIDKKQNEQLSIFEVE